MSYLLSKLKEWKDCSPEELKTNLFREGLVDWRLELKHEVYLFYKERLKYYKRQRIHNPKTQARFETQKAFDVAKDFIYSCLELFD